MLSLCYYNPWTVNVCTYSYLYNEQWCALLQHLFETLCLLYSATVYSSEGIIVRHAYASKL